MVFIYWVVGLFDLQRFLNQKIILNCIFSWSSSIINRVNLTLNKLYKNKAIGKNNVLPLKVKTTLIRSFTGLVTLWKVLAVNHFEEYKSKFFPFYKKSMIEHWLVWSIKAQPKTLSLVSQKLEGEKTSSAKKIFFWNLTLELKKWGACLTENQQ